MATEASCERLFSVESLLKNKHRNQLGAGVLDMLVFVKVNMAKLASADDKARLIRYVRDRIQQIENTPDAIHVIPETLDLGN